MKYLVVKCEELHDQYECDANKTPFCLTDDYSNFGIGYKVYEILSNNKFKLIKDYDDYNERGIAVYAWNSDSLCEQTMPDIIFEKFKNVTRDDITKNQIKKLKSKYHFTDTINEIYSEIRHTGAYADEIDDKFIVIGEYFDSDFASGI